MEILGSTMAEAFVILRLRHRKDVAAADDMTGAALRARPGWSALLAGGRFRELPGEAVGLLLPASAACDVVLLALHLAGKLPVVLNWTTGPANLAHAARVMELATSSRPRRSSTVPASPSPGTEYLFLEEMQGRWAGSSCCAPCWPCGWRPGSVRAGVPPVAPDSRRWCCSPAARKSAPRPCR